MLVAVVSCHRGGPQLPVWLEGTWTSGDSIGLVTESWEKINSGLMAGEALFATAEGKTIIEVLSIFTDEGKLVYAALVPDQNEGKEIIFIDTNLQPDSLVFSNPGHDYPKKIVYHRLGPDQLGISLYGSKKRADKTIVLNRITE